MHIMDWKSLRDFSNAKLIKSMGFWLIITPIMAKLLENVSSLPIQFTGEKTNQFISLSLPFSWVYLFFAALSFSLVNLIVALRCPKLIIEFENYSDFKHKSNSKEYLVQQFLNEFNAKRETPILHKYKGRCDHLFIEDNAPKHNVQDRLRENLSEDSVKLTPDLYSIFLLCLREGRFIERMACFIFIAIGFFLIFCITVENAISVMRLSGFF